MKGEWGLYIPGANIASWPPTSGSHSARGTLSAGSRLWRQLGHNPPPPCAPSSCRPLPFPLRSSRGNITHIPGARGSGPAREMPPDEEEIKISTGGGLARAPGGRGSRAKGEARRKDARRVRVVRERGSARDPF